MIPGPPNEGQDSRGREHQEGDHEWEPPPRDDEEDDDGEIIDSQEYVDVRHRIQAASRHPQTDTRAGHRQPEGKPGEPQDR